MPRDIADYPEEIVKLSKSAMLELWRSLRRYNEAMILIGGWSPYFILETFAEEGYPHNHVGSIDIDIAINPKLVSEKEYVTMEQIILKRGYKQKKSTNTGVIPFKFEKVFSRHKREISIEVDFVSSFYGIGSRRHHQVSGLFARKCHGVDIAFDHYFEQNIKGSFPDDGETEEVIRIADVIASLTMKGIVLGERYKEKDAYDIYYLIKYYKTGPKDAATEINKYTSNSLVQEALKFIQKDFTDKDSPGPTWVAVFLRETEDNRNKRLTDVHMNVSEFLKHIKTDKYSNDKKK